MRAVGEELERGGSALDPLYRRARLHPGQQVLDQLEADARGREAERLQRQCRIVRRRDERRRKYAGRAVDAHVFDASRKQRAQRVGEPQLVDDVGGAAVGAG
jgi:hypothetical protein